MITIGAPLSDNPEDAPITYSFSPAIRSAFARVSDISQYTLEELQSTTEWVVVSQQKLGEPTGLLENTWFVDVEPVSHYLILQNYNRMVKLKLLIPL